MNPTITPTKGIHPQAMFEVLEEFVANLEINSIPP